MVELFEQTSSLIIIRLLLLLYVAKGSSSLNLREKRTIPNRISKPCKGKPNSRAWNIQWLFRSNRLPFIPTRGSVPPQATVGPYAHQCAGRTSIARLHHRTPVRYAEHTVACRCVGKTKIRVLGGYVHSSGWLVTRLTAYRISRYVASTFKRLTTATTHSDLIKFSSTQTGFLPTSWITTPLVILMVVTGMYTMQLL
jgi:DNA-binding GntR family transcriptional regulator